MALLRWVPFKDLLFLQERLSRVFDEAFARYAGLENSSSAWCPPTDIFETVEKVIVKVELPGVDINDVDVEIKDNIVVLRGERKIRRNLKSEHYHRMECSYGAFHRVFTLTPQVDKSAIKASFKDGVLEIIIPKAKESESTHVQVEPE